jgi:hypothetical protein
MVRLVADKRCEMARAYADCDMALEAAGLRE